MKKISIIFVWGVIIVVSLIAVVSFLKFNYTDRVDAGLPVAKTSSPLDTTYTIGDQPYALLGGHVEKEVAPDSAMKEKVSVFGEPVYGDLDADGDLDAALFIVQESGGSGVFYYIAVAVNDGGVYKGTNAMLLGDRIAPQTIEVRNGRAVANYAERKANEAFSVAPSVGKSIWIHLDIKK